MEQHLANESEGEQPEQKSPDLEQTPVEPELNQPEAEQKALELERKPSEIEPSALATVESAAETAASTAPEMVESTVSDIVESTVPAPVEQRLPEPEQRVPEHATAPPSAPPPPLEVWAQNERMRHVPTLTWMIEKVDGDIRKRIELLVAVFDTVPSADPRHRPIEEALFGICHSLDRLADSARRYRGVSHPPAEVAHRIPWSMNTALSTLRNVDASTFGRRHPFHTFERSGSESIYGALMVVIQQIERAVPLIREFDPAIDERLHASLVQLNEPMRTEAIA